LQGKLAIFRDRLGSLGRLRYPTGFILKNVPDTRAKSEIVLVKSAPCGDGA